MSFVSSPPDVVSRLTDSYHQTILSLAETSNTEISWHVSQHVLDRIWVRSSTSATNTSSNSSVVGKNNVLLSSATATEDEIIVCACQGCGYILHPGWKGTNLRVQRPNKKGQTVRRREQRKRKKELRAEETRAKDDHRNRRRRSSVSSLSNVDTNKSNNSVSTVSTDNQQLILLQDDQSLARNHLVLTCGRCKKKIYLKGLRREQQQQQMITNLNTAITDKKMRVLTSSTATNTATMGTLADNFEPLPTSSSTAVRSVNDRKRKPVVAHFAAKTAAASTATATNPSSSSSLSLLEQRKEQKFGRKKKKKSKSISSDKKTGNLLDFLSALNDH